MYCVEVDRVGWEGVR